MTDATLSQPAEQRFAAELAALRNSDDAERPPRWQLSPRAAVTYLMGGTLDDGTEISPKYIGNQRLIETAVATLATDRALLLLGVPGTAKSWVSEHIAAAVSGDSTRIVQCTAGTDENQIRYGWNYAQLLAHGPSREALVQTPLTRAMETGVVVRFEELTRMGSDVQDTLITVLSEKVLPIPELDDAVAAVPGFNMIATANNRDKGVNELSSALKRRFNVVVLPLPNSLEDEIAIVTKRANEIGLSLTLPEVAPADKEIARVGRGVPRAARRPDAGRQGEAEIAQWHVVDGRGHCRDGRGMVGSRPLPLRQHRCRESRGEPARRHRQGPGPGCRSVAGVSRDRRA